ncbi:MAG: ABC transporter permease, partial [Deltaproteobacteria bacterium]
GRCPPNDPWCAPETCRETCLDYCEGARFLHDTDPFPENPYRGEVVLGKTLADLLDVDVGDRVAVTTATARGRTFGALYRVTGLLKTGSLEINRTLAITHIGKLAQGLEIEGGATSVVLRVENLEDADETARTLQRLLDPEKETLAVRSWKELAPELDIFVKIDQGSLLVTLLLLTMVVGVVIANIVTMSVMERTREYGVRMAIGESPGRLAAGMVMEVVLLALFFGGIGALLGEALNGYFQWRGIDFGLGEIEGAGVVLQSVIHTEVTCYGLLFSLGTILGFSLIGALYPIWRIYHLRPVEALRFV